MPFATFEAQLRDELTRMLGAGGFNANRDIAAITVNRWGHGYAYGINTLFDEEPDPPVDVTGTAEDRASRDCRLGCGVERIRAFGDRRGSPRGG